MNKQKLTKDVVVLARLCTISLIYPITNSTFKIVKIDENVSMCSLIIAPKSYASLLLL